MNLLEKIKLLCKQKDITIYRLEKECGLSINSIVKWENASPRVDSLSKIADYFGVSLDYLAGREEKTVATVQQENVSVSSNASEMLSTFNQLSDDSQIMCIGFAEQMLRHETEKQQKTDTNKTKRQKSV